MIEKIQTRRRHLFRTETMWFVLKCFDCQELVCGWTEKTEEEKWREDVQRETKQNVSFRSQGHLCHCRIAGLSRNIVADVGTRVYMPRDVVCREREETEESEMGGYRAGHVGSRRCGFSCVAPSS